jgi:hypothetical protein
MGRSGILGRITGPPNKGMKLTKLSAAWLPEWTCRLMPAPANRMARAPLRSLSPVFARQWRGQRAAAAPDGHGAGFFSALRSGCHAA